MTHFDLSKLNLAYANILNSFQSNCSGTDVLKWHWRLPASKMSNSRLSK